MRLPLDSAPESICLLRLSAVGDVCHALPVVRTIQKHWPHTKISWIIGAAEHSLLAGVEDVEFIVFDKRQGLAAYKKLYRQLKGRQFSVLLHMQMSLRASLVSAMIHSPIKLGFDRQRANDMQWLFTNYKIPHVDKQHVIESFFTFIHTLGLPHTELEWNIPVVDEDRTIVRQLLASHQPYVVISPCSSHAYRNWTQQGYARVAQYIIDKHHRHVVISGGNNATEQAYGDYIEKHVGSDKLLNLTGKTTLKQLLVLLEQADALIAPDSGPAHMATAVGTPVIGLYATTNPDRARAYLSAEGVINQYPQAVQDKYHKPVNEMPWGTRVRDSGTMARIDSEAVCQKIDALFNNAYSK